MSLISQGWGVSRGALEGLGVVGSGCLGSPGSPLRLSGPFSFAAPLSHVPIPLPSYSPNSIRGLALSDAVSALVEKEAIEIAPLSPGFYSRLFVTPKVTGGYNELQ